METIDSITVKFAELEGKIDATYEIAKKTHRMILITSVTTAILFVLPLIVFLFVPSILGSFFSAEGVTPQDLQNLGL